MSVNYLNKLYTILVQGYLDNETDPINPEQNLKINQQWKLVEFLLKLNKVIIYESINQFYSTNILTIDLMT